MRALAALLLFLVPLAAPHSAGAEDVVLGLSRDSVSISTNFDGSEILIFGAVKRETEIRRNPPLQVIVTVAGPDQPVTVRRKERRFGIWINVEAARIDAAPSFYAVATSAPWADVISDTEDLRHRISVPRAIRAVGTAEEVIEPQSFTDAVIRIREASNLYQLRENAVELREHTLFDTAIAMPANLTEGTYLTRIFLTRGGEVISRFETTIEVRKVGLERWLFALSRQQPLLYGLMSLGIAIAAGWGASAAFRLLRP